MCITRNRPVPVFDADHPASMVPMPMGHHDTLHGAHVHPETCAVTFEGVSLRSAVEENGAAKVAAMCGYQVRETMAGTT
jgi:hypothetical protein